MSFVKNKKRLLSKLQLIGTTITLIAIRSNICLAESGIGTSEVKDATENIKRVITSIAMPLGRSINFCKCCSCSIKDDC